MTKNVMSLNAMVEKYVHYGVDEETWNFLYNLKVYGLITDDRWTEFYNICKDWSLEDGNRVVDGDGLTIYRTDENGVFYKVA